MKKNLIIVCAGDNSLHESWVCKYQFFDLVVIYYGDSDEIYDRYAKTANVIIREKGFKWHLIYNYIKNNIYNITPYEYIWFPDDDIETNCDDIHKLFLINNRYLLWLSQPTLDGYVSYDIERKIPSLLLRYTTFVEIISPVMSLGTVFNLLETFKLNESGWGLDYLWPNMLGYPRNKIGIIDAVTVKHTKPVGSDYSRFKNQPMDELKELFNQYKLSFNIKTISNIEL